LAINGITVHVFEFPDTAARQATSNRISASGFSPKGGGSVSWDGEGNFRFWAKDAFIINYWGMDTAVAALITSVLGPPFADGSPDALPVNQSDTFYSINRLTQELTAAGATVVNNGQISQGLFDGEDIILWDLTVNAVPVKVFEFPTETAREVISARISPRGDEYTVVDGETTVTTTMDGISYFRWWAQDNVLVSYADADTAVGNLITTILGVPFADGSQPYRPEAGSGRIAGIGQYGVSFQYDPYLAAGISAEITMGQEPTGVDDFIYDIMPQHITFTFLHSYLDDRTFYHQTVNIPDQPQIIVFPLESYANMSNIAQGGERAILEYAGMLKEMLGQEAANTGTA
jgi:hypothetical protein